MDYYYNDTNCSYFSATNWSWDLTIQFDWQRPNEQYPIRLKTKLDKAGEQIPEDWERGIDLLLATQQIDSCKNQELDMTGQRINLTIYYFPTNINHSNARK